MKINSRKQNLNQFAIMRVFILALVIFTGCRSYKFAPRGILIDRYEFYNDSLDLSIKVPGDYINYSSHNNYGVKTNRLYKEDKHILKEIQIDFKNTLFLFSAKPDFEPFYNVIAFVTDNRHKEATKQGYHLKLNNDSIIYYYKTFSHTKNFIYHSIIPYRNKSLNFLYYINKNSYNPVQDIEELSLLNAERISLNNATHFNGSECNCNENKVQKEVLIHIPDNNVTNKLSLIKIYETNNTKMFKIRCYKLLKSQEKKLYLNLCSGKYLIVCIDLKNKIKWKKELQVEEP